MANKVSYLIFHITGIRNCLNATRLLPIMHYLMPVVQLYIFLAQWRLVLSESAVSCFPHVFIKCHCCLLLLSRCTTRYMNYFTCDVNLTRNYRVLCNKCPSGKSSENCSYSDFSCAISGFTSNSRAPGGPVTEIQCTIFYEAEIST